MNIEAFNKIIKYYRENKISHAYLIETNNLDKCFEDLKLLIKHLFCNQNYKLNCHDCNICNLIDQNYLPSLVIVEPNGSFIKKEQIIELKKVFSSMPIYTKENIYVIKEAEKLNDSSANTMLKFIEEPEDHIIGFLITNNANNVIPTIKSRTELIKVYYDDFDYNSLLNDTNLELYNVAKEYLYKIEVEKTNSIMYNKDVLFSKLTEKEDFIKLFKLLLIIYESIFNKKCGLEDKFGKISEFSFLLKYDNDNLIKKISLITSVLEDINTNVNKELLLDKFVIELGDING